MKVKVLYALTGLTTILLMGRVAFGDVPIVDITQQVSGQETSASAKMSNESSKVAPPDPVLFLPVQPLTDGQRIARLEQQMNNLIDMNLPQQITDLQQQLAQVRGQLQEQQHDLQLLNDRLLTQLKNLNSNTSDNSSSQKSIGNSLFNNKNTQLQGSTVYRAALNFLNKKQYTKSLISFKNYLDNYPNGNYVANAHYWLGETYLEQKNIKKAVLEFQTVRNRFPKSEKVLNAELRLAIIHAETGQVAQAKQELMEIKKQHSGSTVAQLASIRLQQLEATNPPSMNSLQHCE